MPLEAGVRRFQEQVMSRLRTSRRLALVVPAAFGALALTALPALATSSPAQIATSKANGVAYLKSLQAADGSYAGSGLSNEWAFSAFAAAGTAVVDVAPGGDTTKNARTVYRNLLSTSGWPSAAPVVTDYERGTLNAYAAGIDPARVSASRNLVADIYSYWQTAEPGYFGPSANFNGTVFAALALGGARTQAGAVRIPQTLTDAMVTRIRANQHVDGGWTYSKAEGDPTALNSAGDVDMTGAAMAALRLGRSPHRRGHRPGQELPQGQTGRHHRRVQLPLRGQHQLQRLGRGRAERLRDQPADRRLPHRQRQDAGRLPDRQPVQPGGGFKYQPSDTAPSAYSSIDALRGVVGGGFTAAPPVPVTPGAPRWVAQPAFTTGTAAKLALTVDDGTGTLKVCSVAVTPTGTTTTLGDVLAAATGAATPAGCVTGVTPSSGTGAVTALNGKANSGSSTWKVSVDGSAFTGALREKVINVGDTVALRLGA